MEWASFEAVLLRAIHGSIIIGLLFPTTCASLADVFQPRRKGSPREAAIFREMEIYGNRSVRPWAGRRIVATMTTTPKRIGMIEPAVDSLLHQSQPLDALYLFVPWVFRRDGTTYTLPEWLPEKHKLTVVRCEDWGPSTHMLEVLKAERDPDTFILQVDDDQMYGVDLLENLLRATGPCAGRAIGAATQHAHTHLGGVVLEGVHGVLFQRRFFDPTIFDFSGFAPNCRLHDDLWISAHLARRGIRRESLGSRFGTRPLSFGFDADALYRGGAGSDNTRNFYLCMASLLHRHPRLWGPAERVVVIAPLLPGYTGDASGKHTDKRAASEALRRIQQLQHRSEWGPHALYLLGPLPSRLASSDPSGQAVVVRNGGITQSGSWVDTFDIVVRDCHSQCGLDTAVQFGLEMEEDPETIVVVLHEPPSRPLQDTLEMHVQCLLSQPDGRQSRQPCRGPRGSLSYWRHAAYEVGRIQGGVFLPTFSNAFHMPWFEGWKLIDKGLLYRDDNGPWQEAPVERDQFDTWLTLSERDARIGSFWQESERSQPEHFGRLGAVLRSLRHQKYKLQRVYVFIHARRLSRGCIPAWLANWPRVHAVCSPNSSPATPILEVLLRETAPSTLLLHCDDAHLYGPGLTQGLIHAADLWPGTALGCRGTIYGEHGGPIASSSWGTIYGRGFLDQRLADLASGNCAFQIDVTVAAHLALKGVRTKIVGHSFGTKALRKVKHRSGRSACREQLVAAHTWLWASKSPERCVLFASLLENTDAFLLELTLWYAGLQTRIPDEVVLLANREGLLGSSQCNAVRQVVHADIELAGRFGSGTRKIRSLNGTILDMPLHTFIANLCDKTGTVVHIKSQFGPPRSFLLSVASCADGVCSAKPLLQRSFERELEPRTALTYVSAERLVNERLVEENLQCVSACEPHCSHQVWCGQPEKLSTGAIYDVTIRREAGYSQYTAR